MESELVGAAVVVAVSLCSINRKTMGWLGWAERVGRQGGRASRMGIPKLVAAWGSEWCVGCM